MKPETNSKISVGQKLTALRQIGELIEMLPENAEAARDIYPGKETVAYVAETMVDSVYDHVVDILRDIW